MSLETEAVLDRRRIKRSLTFWRVAAVIAAVLVVGTLLAGEDGLSLTDSRQVARVSIEGMITENRAQLRMLKRIADDDRVKGVILFVNSPGGTTSGGEALFDALRQIAKKKPLVAQFGTVAASAAYIAGLGTDYIVARGNSITGSVGVIMQWPDVSELLAKLGIKVNELKSGPLKSSPSLFQPLDESGREVVQQMIADSQRWFLGLVASRRNINTAEVPGLEQGRVYSGREALAHKLVDEVGGEAEAVRWLEEKRNVPKGLKIVDWRPSRSVDWPLSGAVGRAVFYLVESVSSDLAALLSRNAALGSIGLDGLVSVWQPPKIEQIQ
jgi:protease IV